MREKYSPSECPLCGQALVDKDAVRRLNEQQSKVRAKLEAEVMAEAQEKLAEERAQLERQIRQENASNEKARERTITTLKQKNEELQRYIQRITANERGEANEIDIFDQLRSAFPGDSIEKCRRAGDIIHVVRSEGRRTPTNIGTIIYECKDTLKWSNSFITQIKKAGQTHKTPYIILITRALPAREQVVCVKDDVVIVQASKAVHLATIVRKMVVGIYRAGQRAEDQDAKTNRLLKYLNSDDFREAFGSVVDSSEKLQHLLQDEKTAHERIWKRREHEYTNLTRKTAALDEGIRTILEEEANVPQAKVLLFPRRVKH